MNCKKTSALLLLILLFAFSIPVSSLSNQNCDIINIPTLQENSTYPQSWVPPFQFDPDTPQTITCGSTNQIVLTVINGVGPFVWEIVTGNGYSIGASSESNNTLSCTGTNCCTDFDVLVSIRVTDSRDSLTETTIRNSCGVWRDTSEYVCEPPCNPDYYGGCGSFRYNCVNGSLRYCYRFCPSPCAYRCPIHFCTECGGNLYTIQEWGCPS